MESPNTTNETVKAPDAQTAQQPKMMTSEVRRRQLNADIKARGRNDATGDDAIRADGDLKAKFAVS